MIISQNKELLQKYINENDICSVLDSSVGNDMKLGIYEPDEYIYQQEDELKYLYFFAHGTIKVSYISENGKETIFRILKNRRVMGEIELLLDSPATCTVQALDPVHCILFPLDCCKERLLRDAIFLRYISTNLAEALAVANTATSINLCYSPKMRLVSYILSIEKQGHFYFDFVITSQILGISERHLFRIMSELTQNELISKGKAGYTILNRSELIELSEARYLL